MYRLLFFIVLLSIVALFFIEVKPVLEQSIVEGNPQFSLVVAPDSYMYISYSDRYNFDDLIGNQHFNMLGPVMLLWVLGGNLTLLAFVNSLIFFLSAYSVHRATGIKIFPFLLLLLLNPMIYVGLMSPNKDIMVVSSLLFAAAYGVTHRLHYFLVSIIVALFAKIELTVVLILFYLLLNIKEKLLMVMVVVVVLSFLYPILPGVGFRADALMEGQSEYSLGLSVFLNQIASDYYMYLLVVLPRLFLNVFDGLFTLLRVSDLFYILTYIPIIASSVLILISFYYAVIRSKIKISDEIIILIVSFCLFVSLVPFVHHRYIMPIYPLLLIVVMRPSVLTIKGSFLNCVGRS